MTKSESQCRLRECFEAWVQGGRLLSGG